MKKVIFFIVMPLAVACNNANNNAPKTAGDTSANNSKKDTVSYPYPINYSSQFEIGDPQKSKIILQLWKDYDKNSLDNSAGNFTDTVTMLLPGMAMHTTRDSMLASMKAYRNSFSKVSSSVDAVLSAKSIDKGDEWVLVWGTETHTDKKNMTDSVYLQETWRFNKDGKVDYMMQYQRKPEPATK